MTQLARQDDETRALVRLGFDELHGFTRSIGTMEREIAARTFGYVPAGKLAGPLAAAVPVASVAAFFCTLRASSSDGSTTKPSPSIGIRLTSGRRPI